MTRRTFRARRLPVHRGESAWNALLPSRTPSRELDGVISADVVVIGAGFAGLAAATRLNQIDPTLAIVVLDADDVGKGASGRNSGFLIDLPHDISTDDFAADALTKSRNEIIVARTAIEFYRQLGAESGWAKDIFDPSGKYSVAISDAGTQHLEAYSAKLKLLNEPHELMNFEQIGAITGTNCYRSGLYTPGAVIVQPAALVRAIADRFVAKIRLFERTPVTEISSSPDGCLVRTPKGTVNAGRIVLAINGHAENFGFGRGELLHIFTYASLTEAFEPSVLRGSRRWGATPALPMGTTVRRLNCVDGDRILVRSRYTYNPNIQVGESSMKRANALHDKKFAERFPAQRHLKMQYHWAGAMALTKNTVPLFGEVENRIFAACACNGIGGTKSTAAGIATAEMILGQQTSLSAIFNSFDKPVRLPPRPITSVGARLTLAYREWRAGRE